MGKTDTPKSEFIKSLAIGFGLNLIQVKSKLLLVVLYLLLFLLPKINSGQSPNLGTASHFALFTSVGAFNSVGATSVTGNIGTNMGAFTGFPPGTLEGQIYLADSVSAQAAIDLDSAYSYLNRLGNEEVLSPRVYFIGDAAILTGDLILDGQGNSGALFIIRINGSLTATAFSNIVLINSASLSNVYWQINGAFALGDSAVFKGTVLANGAISMGINSALFGKGLSVGGAISLNNNTIDTTATTNNENILSIELLSFKATLINKNVVLDWSSATETNNSYYSIERSQGGEWQVVGTVNGAGNSTTRKDYSLTDIRPFTGISYYRLKQTDFNGRYQYFDALSINNPTNYQNRLTIYPNPSDGELNVIFNGDQGEINAVVVYSSSGKEVYRSQNYQAHVDLTEKAPGEYFFYYTLSSGTIIKKLIIENQ